MQITKKTSQIIVKNFSQFPLAWLAICFAIGIFAAHFIKFPIYLWFAFVLTVLALTTQALFRSAFLAATVLLFWAFAFSGALLSETESLSVKPNRICQIYDNGQITFQTPVEITGLLQNDPEQTPQGYFLNLRAEKISFNQTEQIATGAVRLFLPLDNSEAKRAFENLELGYGVKMKVVTRLTREDRFRNPGGAIARDILVSKDLDASGSIKKITSIQKLSDAPRFSVFAWIYGWRSNLIKQFESNFSTETIGVLAASLLNNRYFLDKSTASRFREGGTFHVLVISGVHITFIGFLVIWLMRKATRNVIAQFVVASTLLWLFTIAVGAEAPVMRAALMFTIFQAAELFNRQPTSLNSLGATALILLIWRPNDIFDQSSQLTFFSVTAIIAVAFPLLKKCKKSVRGNQRKKLPFRPLAPNGSESYARRSFGAKRIGTDHNRVRSGKPICSSTSWLKN